MNIAEAEEERGSERERERGKEEGKTLFLLLSYSSDGSVVATVVMWLLLDDLPMYPVTRCMH